MESTSHKIRLDKWLWAARFFKTRSLAQEAINGGKIHVNGQRAKPGKEIGIDTKLSISKDQNIFEITVIALNQQRRPAQEAALLYEEDPESKAKRLAEIEKRREEHAGLAYSDQKPNKKERRAIHRFKREVI